MVDVAVAREMYCEHHRSLSQIASALGCPISRVRCVLLEAGVRLRTPSEGRRICLAEGRGVWTGPRAPLSEETRSRISEVLRRNAEGVAVGTSVKPSGYIEFTRGPNKGRSVHRVVMEEVLGRRLTRREHVHHRDGNRANNEPDNLEVLDISEHVSLHRRRRV